MGHFRTGWHIVSAILLACAAPARAHEPAPLQAYGDLPGIEAAAISSSGKYLALVGRIHGQRQLIVLNEAREPVRLAPLADLKIRDLDWVGDDEVVLIHSGTRPMGGMWISRRFEFFGALVFPIEGEARFWSVFENSQTLAKSIYGTYGSRLIDGKWQGFFGGLEFVMTKTGPDFTGSTLALMAVDMKRNTARRVARGSSAGLHRSWVLDPRGEVAATFEMADRGRWQIANAAGTILAHGIDPEGDVGLLGLGRDGTSIVYSTEDQSDGVVRWYEAPLAGGPPAAFLPNQAIGRLYFDRNDGRLIGYVDRATDEAHFFEPAREARARLVYRTFAKLHVTIKDWTSDFGRLLVHTSGNGDSGTWYVIDMTRMKADAVGDDHPLILPERVGPISLIRYTAADGLGLDGVLTLPPGRDARNLPVVVLPHGGPASHDDAQFDWWAQAFASRGYAVFQPNFRGSTNRDDAFRRAGYGEWGRKMQTDLSDGLVDLARQGIVDPKRACIMGASYGGYAALGGVTLQQGIYRCAVAVAPVSDLDAFYETRKYWSGDSQMTWRAWREALGARSTYAEVSPRQFAAKADAPILLIHGKDDTVVPFDQSTAMANALKAAGKPHEMVVLREEDHWLSRAATRKQMLEAAVVFVQKHNPAE